MRVKIVPSVLSGEIKAPPSKSYAHRFMILACLSNKTVRINNVGSSQDVLATAKCLRCLGADCDIIGGDFIVRSFTPKDSAVLDCGESGSTLRFMLPIAAALGVRATFIGSAKLLSRPSEPLIKALNSVGANVRDFIVSGKINKNNITIDGSVSSQYVSGLMMSLSVLKGQSRLNIVGDRVSENYVDITVKVMKDFGVNVEKTDTGYLIDNGFNDVKEEYTVEGDYSGAAFYLCAGALGGKVRVSGLNTYSSQGDAKIIEILKAFGADVINEKDGFNVSHNTLHGINIDCENVPDLAQIISVVAAFSKGKSVLSGISRLKYKESDRIKAITDMLTSARIKWELSDALTVYGGMPNGGKFDSKNDHRTAMSCAVLAAYAKGNSLIEGAEAVKKSYPNFYKDFISLGGKVNVDI